MKNKKINNEYLKKLESSGVRFVKIKPGTKSPIEKDWQKNPRTLDEINTDSLGVLLGRYSPNDEYGFVALDIDSEDGYNAIKSYLQEKGQLKKVFFENNNIFTYLLVSKDSTFKTTFGFTSGQPYKQQLLFKVKHEDWMKTTKVQNDGKTLYEFRYQGCQSVVPPSIHPTTKKPYEWTFSCYLHLLSLDDIEVLPLPDVLIELWKE